MAYPAATIANYFLDRIPETNSIKLQKLIFFANGWHWAICDYPLIFERFCAWDYGPVLYDLYYQFKHFGNNPITSEAFVLLYYNNNGKTDVRAAGAKCIYDDFTIAFLNRIIEVYGHLTAVQLTNMTHAAGSPWTVTPNKGVDAIISDASFVKYFKAQLDRAV